MFNEINQSSYVNNNTNSNPLMPVVKNVAKKLYTHVLVAIFKPNNFATYINTYKIKNKTPFCYLEKRRQSLSEIL